MMARVSAQRCFSKAVRCSACGATIRKAGRLISNSAFARADVSDAMLDVDPMAPKLRREPDPIRDAVVDEGHTRFTFEREHPVAGLYDEFRHVAPLCGLGI